MSSVAFALARVALVTNRDSNTLNRMWLPAAWPADLACSRGVDGTDLRVPRAAWSPC